MSARIRYFPLFILVDEAAKTLHKPIFAPMSLISCHCDRYLCGLPTA